MSKRRVQRSQDRKKQKRPNNSQAKTLVELDQEIVDNMWMNYVKGHKKNKPKWVQRKTKPEDMTDIAVRLFGGTYYCVGEAKDATLHQD